jgi:hypothetical protein
VASSAATLTDAALRHAADAWSALIAPDPAGLAGVAATASAELRFVAEAFDRLGREYPSTRDGLSLTERRIVAAVAGGATTASSVFGRVAARETRPFLGDSWCFDRIARLVAAPHPLLESDVGAPETAVGRPEALTGLRLTSTGQRVLEGEADHVELNGVDRWVGGVHLRGTHVRYRWHEGIESVITTRPGLGGR